MEIDLEQIGLSKEALQERVVETITEKLLYERYIDEEKLEKALNILIKEAVDKKISLLASETIVPNVNKYIENICLQETTKWGKKIGEPVSFIDYLVNRGESYLSEKLDSRGCEISMDTYGWKQAQTRLTHMVNSRLHRSVEEAMEKSLKNINKSILDGLRATIEIKLAEIAKKVRVTI